MRFPLFLAVLAASVASAQPVAPDSTSRRAEYSLGTTSGYTPTQTSAAHAYLYSAAATGGLVLVGVLVDAAVGDLNADEDGTLLDGVGPALVVTGVLVGPAVGNMTLGATDEVRRGMRIKMVGVGTGLVLAGGGLLVGINCVLSNFDGGDDGGCSSVAGGLFVAGAVAGAAGAVAGGVYDLATIPRSAERARAYRPAHSRFAVAPGWARGPAMSVRIGL